MKCGEDRQAEGLREPEASGPSGLVVPARSRRDGFAEGEWACIWGV